MLVKVSILASLAELVFAGDGLSKRRDRAKNLAPSPFEISKCSGYALDYPLKRVDLSAVSPGLLEKLVPSYTPECVLGIMADQSVIFSAGGHFSSHNFVQAWYLGASVEESPCSGRTCVSCSLPNLNDKCERDDAPTADGSPRFIVFIHYTQCGSHTRTVDEYALSSDVPGGLEKLFPRYTIQCIRGQVYDFMVLEAVDSSPSLYFILAWYAEASDFSLGSPCSGRTCVFCSLPNLNDKCEHNDTEQDPSAAEGPQRLVVFRRYRMCDHYSRNDEYALSSNVPGGLEKLADTFAHMCVYQIKDNEFMILAAADQSSSLYFVQAWYAGASAPSPCERGTCVSCSFPNLSERCERDGSEQNTSTAEGRPRFVVIRQYQMCGLDSDENWALSSNVPSGLEKLAATYTVQCVYAIKANDFMVFSAVGPSSLRYFVQAWYARSPDLPSESPCRGRTCVACSFPNSNEKCEVEIQEPDLPTAGDNLRYVVWPLFEACRADNGAGDAFALSSNLPRGVETSELEDLCGCSLTCIMERTETELTWEVRIDRGAGGYADWVGRRFLMKVSIEGDALERMEDGQIAYVMRPI